ncbi:MAG: Asp-tRNA(Asn)/Glu-tRNA(Gln) amidotransferase subunit GatA [bacterium]
MSGKHVYELSILELSRLLRQREISSVEVIRAVLNRIEETDPFIDGYIMVNAKMALEHALKADEIFAGYSSEDLVSHWPLLGVPIALKDNICTRGIKTSCASRILSNFNSPYNATVAQKLLNRGAIIIGKANMDEFAMGSSTETSYFGCTRNPWDTSRTPGGSSGGSAAIVAADEAMAALGSDTGGSIRQPASFCGVVGLKPTYGRVSRFGLVAFASSLDQIGPITKNVADCALLMNVISGYDPNDSTSVNIQVPEYEKHLIGDVRGMKIGIPREYFQEGLDREVEEAVRRAISLLHSLGAEVDEVDLPHTEYAIATYYILATAEASSNLARYDGVRYGFRDDQFSDLVEMYKNTRQKGFGAEVKRRIMLGTYALSSGYYDAYYLKAQKVRTLIKQDFERAFKRFDVLLTPTAPLTSFRIGEKIDDPLQMYLLDIFTISANLAGIPAISVPCGFSKQGMPIGMQLLGGYFKEEKLIQAAYTYEQNTHFYQRKPDIRGRAETPG